MGSTVRWAERRQQRAPTIHVSIARQAVGFAPALPTRNSVHAVYRHGAHALGKPATPIAPAKFALITVASVREALRCSSRVAIGLALVSVLSAYILSVVAYLPDIRYTHMVDIDEQGASWAGECTWDYMVISGRFSTRVEFILARWECDITPHATWPRGFGSDVPCDPEAWEDYFEVVGVELVAGWPFRAVRHQFVGAVYTEWSYPAYPWDEVLRNDSPLEIPDWIASRNVDYIDEEATRLPIRPIWLGLFANAAVYYIALLGMRAVCVWMFQARRRLKRQCPKCGYSLHGLREPRCPECGGGCGK